MFKSLTVQFTNIKNVFTVKHLTIHCNLSRKAIGKEFDMLKAKFMRRESILLKLDITQLNIEINHDTVTLSFLAGCIFSDFRPS